MRCEQIRDLLSPYIDKMTDEKETRAVEAHFEVCEHCREELKQLELLCGLMHNINTPEIPDSFSNDLHKRLLEEKTTLIRPKEIKKPRKSGWIAAAVAGIAMAAGIYASSILPVGTIASWFDKADEKENRPSVAIEEIIKNSPSYDNEQNNNEINSSVDIALNSDVNKSVGEISEISPDTNPVEPDTDQDASNVIPDITPEVEPREGDVCTARIVVEDANDSLGRIIQIADANEIEFISTSNDTAQVLSSTDAKEVVFRVDTDNLEEFLNKLGEVGKISSPLYNKTVLTEQYSSIENEISSIEDEIQAITSQEGELSSADEANLTELDSQLQEWTGKKAQLEKELNMVTVKIIIIENDN